MGMNPIWFYYFSFRQNLSCRSGEGDSHTTTQSDLDGAAIQLNPVLIQTPTVCVPLALICRLYVQQHKANPGFTQSGNEIRCSAANVFRLCSTSSGLFQLPAEQSGRAALPKKRPRLQLLIQKGSCLLQHFPSPNQIY